MTDTLRTRIAAAALNAYEGRSNAWEQSRGDIRRQDWLEVADAIIRELGWIDEFRIDIGYGGYESEPSREQALERMAEIVEDWGDDPPETGVILQRRYVTEWETDDV